MAHTDTEVLYNPHPSRDPKYDVRIVRDNEDGTVDVRYVSGGPAWTVNDDVPEIWGRVEPGPDTNPATER